VSDDKMQAMWDSGVLDPDTAEIFAAGFFRFQQCAMCGLRVRDWLPFNVRPADEPDASAPADEPDAASAPAERIFILNPAAAGFCDCAPVDEYAVQSGLILDRVPESKRARLADAIAEFANQADLILDLVRVSHHEEVTDALARIVNYLRMGGVDLRPVGDDTGGGR